MFKKQSHVDPSVSSGTSPTKSAAYYSLLFPQLPVPFNQFVWKTEGFSKFARGVLAENCAAFPAIVPDAWYVDDGHHITILEVVETNDIDDDKARKLTTLWWGFDNVGYEFSVLLFYPRTQSTVAVPDLYAMDGHAAKLEGRQHPYRDAFNTLKVRVAAQQAVR